MISRPDSFVGRAGWETLSDLTKNMLSFDTTLARILLDLTAYMKRLEEGEGASDLSSANQAYQAYQVAPVRPVSTIGLKELQNILKEALQNVERLKEMQSLANDALKYQSEADKARKEKLRYAGLLAEKTDEIAEVVSAAEGTAKSMDALLDRVRQQVYEINVLREEQGKVERDLLIERGRVEDSDKALAERRVLQEELVNKITRMELEITGLEKTLVVRSDMLEEQEKEQETLKQTLLSRLKVIETLTTQVNELEAKERERLARKEAKKLAKSSVQEKQE